jgi:hypothetical protein
MYESRTSRGAGIGNAGRSTALTLAIAFLLWLALPGILTPTSSEPVEPALPNSVRTGWWSEVNSNCPAASRCEFIDFVNFFASGLDYLGRVA